MQPKRIFNLIYRFAIKKIMYHYSKDHEKGRKKAYGIKKNVFKKEFKHWTHKGVLFNDKQMLHSMKTISSKNHHLGCYKINEISIF